MFGMFGMFYGTFAAGASRSNAHPRRTTQMSNVRQILQSEMQPENSRASTQRNEELLVRDLSADVRDCLRVVVAQTGARRRQVACVRDVRIEVPTGGRFEPPCSYP